MPPSSIFKNERWNRKDEKRNYRRLVIHTSDNEKHLPPDYIPALVAKYGDNTNLIRAHLFGEFCPLVEGSAYSNYIPDRHDVPDENPDPYLPIAFKWDFNAEPLAWVASQKLYVGTITRTKKWIALHNSEAGSSNLTDATLEFAAKFPLDKFSATPIGIYGDRTGHAGSHKIEGSDFENIQKILKRLGYARVSIFASRQVAPENDSVECVQNLFLYNLFALCRRCDNLRKSLLSTSWKEGTRKLSKPAGETWTHWADALKYWCYQERNTLFKGTPVYGMNY